MKRLLATMMLMATLIVPSVAAAQQQSLLDQAVRDALATFERAAPSLSGVEFGVDMAAYGRALRGQTFQSAVWGGQVSVKRTIRDAATGSCGRFAAFVRIPPENGVVSLVLCPQFFTEGADALRELTILHEMVHVVAGSSECQAMALAARIEQAAHGRFTPVGKYWAASGCEGSPYRLPD